MNFEITHRRTGASLWSGKAVSLKGAVEKAALDGANLTGANLTDANLTGANLYGANLVDANLDDANLDDANLNGASLPIGFDLSKHVGQPRSPATTPTRRTVDELTPEQRAARRKEARATHAQHFRERHPGVPVVPHLDAVILRDIESNQMTLDMGAWHGSFDGAGAQQFRDKSIETILEACGTTHCRAGAAVHAAGAAGYELERRLESAQAAGCAIYRASTGRIPHFYASNERALEDLRRCADEDPLPAPPASPARHEKW